MIPKEKAKELFDKFYSAIPNDEMGENYESSKKCALIAVNELSKFLVDVESEDFNLPDEFSIQYWQEVKQEIENL
jgi:hypothetical protein